MPKETCIRVFADVSQIRMCRRKVRDNLELFSRLAGILSLGGNEVRLKILFLLEEEGELCPCDMADILGMTVPAVSQHLRKMKDGKIIETRRAGQTIYYSLKRENLKMLNPIFKHINLKTEKQEAI